MPTISSRLLALALLAVSGAAPAQNSPAPDLVPGLDRFDLAPRTQPAPAPTQAPRATPTRVPAPRPTPTPTRAPTPRATATPTPAATRAPTVIASPTPAPSATPIVRETPVPAPIASTASVEPASLPAPAGIAPVPPGIEPAATALPSAATGETDTTTRWIALGILAALALAAAWLWQRRRRAAADRFTVDVDEIAEPEAALPPVRATPDMPAPASFPPASPLQPAAPASPAPHFLTDSPPPAARATLEIGVRAIRAGTNLTSAAVDYEIDIRNSGEHDATDIRMDIRLLSASADQDRILAALYATPIDKPIIAPFEIPAGEQVSLGGMAMLPREALSILSAEGRDFFVPLLSINLVYTWDGDGVTGQTAGAHIVGIEREGGAKMAPFRLDVPPRMHDRVGVRDHTLIVRH